MGKQSILKLVLDVFLSIALFGTQGGNDADRKGKGYLNTSFLSGMLSVGPKYFKLPPSWKHCKDQHLPGEVTLSTRFFIPTGSGAGSPSQYSARGKNHMKTLSGATGCWKKNTRSCMPKKRNVDEGQGRGAKAVWLGLPLALSPRGRWETTLPQTDRQQTDRRPRWPRGQPHTKAKPGALG